MSLIEGLYNIGMSEQISLLKGPHASFKPSRRFTLLQNYDPTAYPPDLTFAAEHGQSRNVGKSITALENVDRCRCCLEPIHKERLPLSCNLSELQHCGESTPFYFVFIKQVIILLGFNCIMVTLPAVLINFLLGSECENLNGEVRNILNNVCRGSVINIMNIQVIDAMQMQAIVFFTAVVMNIILIAFLQVKMEDYVSKANTKKDSAAEYSFIIKGLPSDITIMEIQKYVEDKILRTGAPDADVVKIYLIYNVKDYLKELKKKQKVLQKRIELQFQIEKLQQQQLQQKKDVQKFQIQKKIAKINENINEIDLQLQNIELKINIFETITNELTFKLKHQGVLEDQKLNKDILNFSGRCIITIDNKQSRNMLIEAHRVKGYLRRFVYWISELLSRKKSKIMITAAPQPADILFGNIGSKKTIIWKKRIQYSAVIFFFILLDFLLVGLTKKFLKEEKAIQKGNIFFSFLNSIIVSLFCAIFRRVIGNSQEQSCYSTLSKLCYNKLAKIVVIFQINMLLTTFVANVASFYLIRQDKSTFSIFPLNFQAFLFDAFFLIVTNPIITLVMTVFDQRHIRAKIKKYRVERGSLPVSQAQANVTFQNINFDICFKYGTIYRFLLFCAGIGIIYPFCFVICFFALSCLYWLDKYLLLRRYSITEKVSSRFTLLAQKIMGQFPLYLSLTNLVVMFIPVQDGSAFKSQKYSKIYYYLSITGVICSCLSYFGGNGWIKRLIRSKIDIKTVEDKSGHLKYKDIQSHLLLDYSHDYPYFRVSKKIGPEQENSFRKQKLQQLKKNEKIGVLQLLQNYTLQSMDQ